MTEKKSKIPSLEEFGKYAGKLFTDIKDSVKEILEDYQKKHAEDGHEPSQPSKSAQPNKQEKKNPSSKAEEKPAPERKASAKVKTTTKKTTRKPKTETKKTKTE